MDKTNEIHNLVISGIRHVYKRITLATLTVVYTGNAGVASSPQQARRRPCPIPIPFHSVRQFRFVLDFLIERLI